MATKEESDKDTSRSKFRKWDKETMQKACEEGF